MVRVSLRSPFSNQTPTSTSLRRCLVHVIAAHSRGTVLAILGGGACRCHLKGPESRVEVP